ncbi:hypothetical protein Pcinc_029741 [Petrolisthes cinctipes]|uniref:Uncharacterized protein n=1 Tax=Petrolisthes cinctipes TaxID=88211 RepID=A0AAE1F079_PETCI|nr:hypothetical protein Pcinc_029741 [Petrolisthes cinctipes]
MTSVNKKPKGHPNINGTALARSSTPLPARSLTGTPYTPTPTPRSDAGREPLTARHPSFSSSIRLPSLAPNLIITTSTPSPSDILTLRLPDFPYHISSAEVLPGFYRRVTGILCFQRPASAPTATHSANPSPSRTDTHLTHLC